MVALMRRTPSRLSSSSGRQVDDRQQVDQEVVGGLDHQLGAAVSAAGPGAGGRCRDWRRTGTRWAGCRGPWPDRPGPVRWPGGTGWPAAERTRGRPGRSRAPGPLLPGSAAAGCRGRPRLWSTSPVAVSTTVHGEDVVVIGVDVDVGPTEAVVLVRLRLLVALDQEDDVVVAEAGRLAGVGPLSQVAGGRAARRRRAGRFRGGCRRSGRRRWSRSGRPAQRSRGRRPARRVG